ncbi:MAG: hypothetical protein ACFB00_09200 [Parvularculaceae bacterium]
MHTRRAMKTLTIRQVPDDVHETLRIRAAQAGRSMEEEVRQVLSRAAGRARSLEDRLAALLDLKAHVRGLYDGAPPENTVEDFLREKRADAEREWERDAR